MTESQDALPVLPHLASEFYLWLWWTSDIRGGSFDLPDPVGHIDLWIDDRLAFRVPGDKKVTAVLTGDSPAETLEAKAALFGGKVLHELRLRFKRDDRDFAVTLKGPEMHVTRASLPVALQDTPEEAIYDRIFLYDELCFVLAALFKAYGEARVDSSWNAEIVPTIKQWVEGTEG